MEEVLGGEGITEEEKYPPEHKINLNKFRSFIKRTEGKSTEDAIKLFHVWKQSHPEVVKDILNMSAITAPSKPKQTRKKPIGRHAILKASIRSALVHAAQAVLLVIVGYILIYFQ